MLHKFEIKSGAFPNDVKILMDGKPLEVTAVEILMDCNRNEPNKIRLEFIPDILDVDINAEPFISERMIQLAKELGDKNADG